MTARDPNVRRALVTRVFEDGAQVELVVEWMKLLKKEDRGAIQGEQTGPKGFKADGILGIQVGDEVLVDLRPLPVTKLSFFYFGLPTLGILFAALLGHGVGLTLGLVPAITLIVQVFLGVAAAVLAYKFADGAHKKYVSEGLGTPMVTAIMPRLISREDSGESPGKDYLQAVFFLEGEVTDPDWEFARLELERVVGVHGVERQPDRIEVVFQQGLIKEKHLLELLTMFNFPIRMDRDPE